ncbi:MAG: hypothetical protein Q8S01_12215 [Ignavibacteria bacterium]|nr:hypothetical protein [Ignavibacteria bacterium]
MSSFFIYIGYGAGFIFSLIGIAIILGLVFPKDIPAQFKYIMGSTLLLYGIYRMTTTYFKAKRNARLFKEDDETTNSNTLP